MKGGAPCFLRIKGSRRAGSMTVTDKVVEFDEVDYCISVLRY